MELSSEKLKEHKIAGIKTYRIRNRYHRLNGKNSRRGEHAYGDELTAKQLFTDQGITGWGLCTSRPFWKHGKELADMDELIMGKCVGDVFDPTYGITDNHYEGFDFALHDLAGRILGIPVYRMLGNEGTNPVSVYDGGILLDDLSPDSSPGGLKRILEECFEDYGMGYRDFKLKIGRGPKWMDLREGIKRDIEVTRMVRSYFPDARIMVDANDAYTSETIKTYIDGVADCGLYWIEEPFREDEEGLKTLREYLAYRSPSTMIADGESRFNPRQILDLAKQGLLDVVQMDIEYLGFTKWRQFVPKLAGLGVKISPHNWGFGMKTRYTASFGAGCPLMDCVEGVIDLTEGVDTSAYGLFDGKMTVPEIPGFGMDLIWAQDITEL